MAPNYAELIELLVEGARYDDAEDVQSALDQGCDVNAQDEQGRTAAHMAAANGHAELLQQLIDAGAAATLTNAEGNTPLHWACINGQKDAVRVLLQAGASPSALNSHETTPVDEALYKGFQDIVDLINEFNNAKKMEDETYDVPDDAEEAGEGDMELDASGEQKE